LPITTIQVLEVDEGRHNCYVAILVFLLSIYKCTKSSNGHAVERMPTVEVRSTLEAVCKGRYTPKGVHDDHALEDYLDAFLDL
jgi:hypothetical protein